MEILIMSHVFATSGQQYLLLTGQKVGMGGLGVTSLFLVVVFSSDTAIAAATRSVAVMTGPWLCKYVAKKT